MKKQVCCIAVLLVVALIFGCDVQPEKVDIGYKKQLTYLPLFVGLEKGYFQQEGLEVNPVIFDSTNSMVAAIVAGQSAAAIGGVNLETVFSVEEKSPGNLEIFTTMDINEGTRVTCVMVKKDSDITDMSQLKGKKAATLPGTFAPIWIDAALKTVGLGKSDLDIKGIDAKLQLAALSSGEVDVVFGVEPICSFGVNKGIGQIIYYEPLRHLGSALTSSVLSSKLDKKIAQRIVRATDRAIDYIRANPDESLKIMAKYSDYDLEMIKGMKVPQFSKSTEVSDAEIQKLADKLYAEGSLSKKIEISGIIFN